MRRHGFFPFRSEERGQLDLDLVQEGLSIRYGRHGEERRIRVPDLERESIVVQPGTEFLLSVPVPVPSGATDVLELTVQAQLFPLAVEFEGEPERLVAVRFPRSRVRFGPAEVVELAGLGDMTRLAEALAERPEQVPALPRQWPARVAVVLLGDASPRAGANSPADRLAGYPPGIVTAD